MIFHDIIGNLNNVVLNVTNVEAFNDWDVYIDVVDIDITKNNIVIIFLQLKCILVDLIILEIIITKKAVVLQVIMLN